MFYTYVLESLKDHKKYIGSTSNLRVRLKAHNDGKVRSTKSRRPFELLYFEKFSTMSEARWRERSFKRSHDLLVRAMSRATQGSRRPRGPSPNRRFSGTGGLVRREMENAVG